MKTDNITHECQRPSNTTRQDRKHTYNLIFLSYFLYHTIDFFKTFKLSYQQVAFFLKGNTPY